MAVNPVSPEEIQSLHDYFSARKDSIPKTIMLTAAERANDVPWLIDQCFEILSNDNIGLRMRGVRLDMLKRIKAAIEREEQK